MARTRTSISVHRLALGHCDLTRKISGEVTTKILYRDLKKFTQHTVGGVGGGSEGADNG